jgi:hypothetical protein
MPPRRNDNETTTPPAPTSTGSQPTSPWRNDNETTSACPNCASRFTPIRRQRYCTPACRQAAWRARHRNPVPNPVNVIPPRTHRRDNTVYQCPECDNRSLGQQWCTDCNRPSVRIDYGGLCPNCDEPVTIQDITDQHTTSRASL